MNRRRTLAAVAGALAITFPLAACGSEAGDDGELTLSAEAQEELDAWLAESIRFVGMRTDSEFVHAILADGEITLAEAQEAVNRTNECTFDGIAALGFTDNQAWGGLRTAETPGCGDEWMFSGGCGDISSSDCDRAMAVMDECELRYSAGLVGTFLETRRFVGSTAGREATVACLKREGLVDDTFTVGMLTLLEIETADPDTCEDALNDDRFINVQCDLGGGFGWGWNPDFVFESRMVPGAPDLNRPPARDCVVNPEPERGVRVGRDCEKLDDLIRQAGGDR